MREGQLNVVSARSWNLSKDRGRLSDRLIKNASSSFFLGSHFACVLNTRGEKIYGSYIRARIIPTRLSFPEQWLGMLHMYCELILPASLIIFHCLRRSKDPPVFFLYYLSLPFRWHQLEFQVLNKLYSSSIKINETNHNFRQLHYYFKWISQCKIIKQFL